MGIKPPVTLRIGRVVVEGASQAEAAATVEALRGELARLAGAGRLPGQKPAGGELDAITPAGRGRRAAGRILPR